MALGCQRSRDDRKLGMVVKVGHAWKALVTAHYRTRAGPQRDTQAAAQADLETARQRASRLEMESFPVAIANEIRRILEMHCSIGSVRMNRNRWRVYVYVDRRMTCGPQRDTQAAAQADLETARQRGSRSGMVSFLKALANS